MQPEDARKPQQEQLPQNSLQQIKKQQPQNSLQPIHVHQPKNSLQLIPEHQPQNLLKPVHDNEPKNSLQPVQEPQAQNSLQPVQEQKPKNSLKPVQENEPQNSLQPIQEQLQPQIQHPSFEEFLKQMSDSDKNAFDMLLQKYPQPFTFLRALWERKRQGFRDVYLTENIVVNELMKIVSENRPPDRIYYNWEGCNETEAFHTFWCQIYSKIGWLGKTYKIPTLALGAETLSSVPKIIKKGWTDERYFPTKISRSFLEACCFRKDDPLELETAILIEMFLDHIEECEKGIVQERLNIADSNLNDDCLTIFKRHFPEMSQLTINYPLKVACGEAIRQTNPPLSEIIEIAYTWNSELNNMIEPTMFNFLLETADNFEIEMSLALPYDDISWNEVNKLPHRMWRTFLKGWPPNAISYYFDVLQRKPENPNFECYNCGLKDNRSKHIVGNDGSDCYTESNIERHDRVLSLIEKEMQKSFEAGVEGRHSQFFSRTDDWIILRRLESEKVWYTIPPELGLTEHISRPHVMVYSMRLMVVLIVETSIRWEKWRSLPHDDRKFKPKARIFGKAVDLLRNNGFEVHFKDIEMGCRGVLCETLYSLFSEYFGMNHPEISLKMEEISKEIIMIPMEYNQCNNEAAR